MAYPIAEDTSKYNVINAILYDTDGSQACTNLVIIRISLF